jgi:hypothetical protein
VVFSIRLWRTSDGDGSHWVDIAFMPFGRDEVVQLFSFIRNELDEAYAVTGNDYIYDRIPVRITSVNRMLFDILRNIDEESDDATDDEADY